MKNKEKKEINNFLKEKQFSEWKKILEFYISNITNENIEEKERNFWILKLYSLYIQFIEIFSINIFIITENTLFKNLFMPNNELKQKIEKQLGSNDYINYLCKNWIFGVKQKEKINNFSEKESLYRNLIKEISTDYTSDQELLNAYKHGFRLESKGFTNIKMMREAKPNQVFSIGDYNSSIFYWTKGRKLKDKDESNIIFENRLFFNWERIEYKFIILDNILENVLKVFFAEGKTVKLSHLYIDDREELNKSFGTMRLRMPIFSLN